MTTTEKQKLDSFRPTALNIILFAVAAFSFLAVFIQCASNKGLKDRAYLEGYNDAVNLDQSKLDSIKYSQGVESFPDHSEIKVDGVK